MNVQYNHKGKYFTKVQSKKTVEVIIQTTNQQIQGIIHVCPDRRLLDELNEAPEFVAITNARIKNGDNELQVDFLALQKEHILWVTPIENPNQEGDNGR
jgi:hypothetical protein